MNKSEIRKQCPVCKHINDAAEVICAICLADISSVCPRTETKPPSEKSIHANTTLSKKPSINSRPSLNSSIKPLLPSLPNSGESKITTVFSEKKLRLKIEEVELELEDGDILGREATGKTLLKSFSGVSRNHALFTYNGKNWEIEDLHSTNGTFINGEKISSEKKYPIKIGDRLGISKKVAFIIID
ncbi:MAG: FHA domain-containing protein [Candidatus Riflebacteria bacterium]|nr:FHA domain-containing protein [Candidatus Riflebacteria bacterium]